MARLYLAAALTLLLGWAAPTWAQPWTPILEPTRATDWSFAGMTGGVPTTRTRCTTGTGTALLPASSTAAQINTAIAGCDANHFVELASGTFNLSAGIRLGTNNVHLKGQGPELTILKMSSSSGACVANLAGTDAFVCITGTSGVWAGDTTGSGTPVPAANVRNWTGTAGCVGCGPNLYPQGATQLILNNTTSLSQNMIIVVDQCDETTDDGGITNSAFGTIFLNESQTRGRIQNTGCASGIRSLEEFHKIVTVDSATQITVTPPIIMPTWRTSQIPQLFFLDTASTAFVTGAGIQALTVDGLSGGAANNISFQNAYEGFADNVRVVGFNRGAIGYRQAAKVTAQNSYFYQANSWFAESYGHDVLSANFLLIQNNIFQFIIAAKLGPAPGSVVAYNYGLDFPFGFPGNAGNNSIGMFATHDAGGGAELYEGNQLNGIISDFPHGQSPLQVMFRNHLRGVDERTTEGCCGANKVVFNFEAFSRGYSAVANVLGLNSLVFQYECNAGVAGCQAQSDGGEDLIIFYLGASRGGSTPTDGLVKTTLLRWGNYDVATDTTRFVAAEVPTAGVRSLNGNPVPSCVPTCLAQIAAIPSFYLSSQPAFFTTPFGTPPWPPIGPDVTGGNHPDPGIGGHANKIPAKLCYENSAIDSTYTGVTQRDRGFLRFNATNCYATSTGGTPPAAPTGLTIVP
jgi:hypothetical protein